MAAKTTYDLRRVRKIYPNKRRTPMWIDTSAEVEAFTITYDTSDTSHSKTKLLARAYSSAPVVVVSAENDNVNVYVSSISESSGEYTVEVTISSLPMAGTITVHGHAAEAQS